MATSSSPPAPDQAAPERDLIAEATDEPRFVEVSPRLFLVIDGAGDPNTSAAYQDAVAALYALAYSLKFARKRASGADYRVGPLEGLWWSDDMTAFTVEPKGNWQWTMMIAQLPDITADLFEAARAAARRKRSLPALDLVRLATYAEGRAAQILHRGPYAAEGPTIARLHQFIADHGATFDGRRQKHHEIYLNDPRRTAPERLKTVLRQPVAE